MRNVGGSVAFAFFLLLVWDAVASEEGQVSESTGTPESLAPTTPESPPITTPVTRQTSESPALTTSVTTEASESPALTTPMTQQSSESPALTTSMTRQMSQSPALTTAVTRDAQPEASVIPSCSSVCHCVCDKTVTTQSSKSPPLTTSVTTEASESPALTISASTEVSESPPLANLVTRQSSESPALSTLVTRQSSESPALTTSMTRQMSQSPVPTFLIPVSDAVASEEGQASESTGTPESLTPTTPESPSLTTPVTRQASESPALTISVTTEASESPALTTSVTTEASESPALTTPMTRQSSESPALTTSMTRQMSQSPALTTAVTRDAQPEASVIPSCSSVCHCVCDKTVTTQSSKSPPLTTSVTTEASESPALTISASTEVSESPPLANLVTRQSSESPALSTLVTRQSSESPALTTSMTRQMSQSPVPTFLIPVSDAVASEEGQASESTGTPESLTPTTPESPSLTTPVTRQASESPALTISVTTEASESPALTTSMTRQSSESPTLSTLVTRQASESPALTTSVTTEASESLAHTTSMTRQASESPTLSTQASESLALTTSMFIETPESPSLTTPVTRQSSESPALSTLVTIQASESLALTTSMTRQMSQSPVLTTSVTRKAQPEASVNSSCSSVCDASASCVPTRDGLYCQCLNGGIPSITENSTLTCKDPPTQGTGNETFTYITNMISNLPDVLEPALVVSLLKALEAELLVVTSQGASQEQLAAMGDSMLKSTEKLVGALVKRTLTQSNQTLATNTTEVKTFAVGNYTTVTSNILIESYNVSLDIDLISIARNNEGEAAVALTTFTTMGSILKVDFFHTANDHDTEKTMMSLVWSASLPKTPNKALTSPATFTIGHVKTADPHGQMSCVYWKDKSWLVDGCNATHTNSTHTVCTCAHFSTFSLIMQTERFSEPDQARVLLERILVAVGLGSLTLALLTFALCHKTTTVATPARLNLCISLLLAHLLFLLVQELIELIRPHRVVRSVLVGVLHVLFLSSFAWMLLETIWLLRSVLGLKKLKSAQHGGPHWGLQCLAGYGAPVAIVAISAGIMHEGYGSEHGWLRYDKGFNWSFLGPVCCVLGVNTILFTVIIVHLRSAIANMQGVNATLNRTLVFKTLMQSVVIGVPWMLGFFTRDSKVVDVVFLVLSSQQGTFIFLLHCVLNQEVQKHYRGWFRMRWFRKTSHANHP